MAAITKEDLYKEIDQLKAKIAELSLRPEAIIIDARQQQISFSNTRIAQQYTIAATFKGVRYEFVSALCTLTDSESCEAKIYVNRKGDAVVVPRKIERLDPIPLFTEEES